VTGRRSLRRPWLPIRWVALALPAVGGADANSPATLQSALHACAALAEPTERLACYDRLAGRGASGSAPPSAAAPGAAAAAGALPTAPVAPAATATSNASAAAGSAAVAQRPAVTPPAAASSSAAPLPKESFGLYAAEHPLPAVAPLLEARVVAVGMSAAGRMTVALEGGALWELDDTDPLLAAGQTVTITRAALGSYLMRTPTRRTHRVRRLH
jgi:hypothetical protein